MIYWNTLPAPVEGAYQSKNFGCICADGLLIFEEGKVTNINLGHKTAALYGTYHKEGEQYFLVHEKYGKKILRAQRAHILIGENSRGARKNFTKEQLQRMIAYPEEELGTQKKQ